MGEETEKQIPSELSLEEAPIKWILNLNDLPDQGVRGEKRADEDELRLLTQMLKDEHDLEVKFLSCSYEVLLEKSAPQKNTGGKSRDSFRGHFRLNAELKQTCIVTLERIDTFLEEEFSQVFSNFGRPSVKMNSEVDEIEDPFAEEPPIRLDKGKIILGPLVYQYLSMAIDPNPRKEGALFKEETGSGEGQKSKQASPFVVLEKYRQKK